jgi:hypothetical protein
MRRIATIVLILATVGCAAPHAALQEDSPQAWLERGYLEYISIVDTVTQLRADGVISDEDFADYLESRKKARKALDTARIALDKDSIAEFKMNKVMALEALQILNTILKDYVVEEGQ